MPASFARFAFRRPAFAATLFAAAVLAAGIRPCVSRKVEVSADFKFREPTTVQVFYTDSPEAGLQFEKCETAFVKAGGDHVRFDLPAARLERIRFDFGTGPGKVRVGKVSVGGTALDWNEFQLRHDIGRFSVDGGGAVDVVATGGDPYAVCTRPLGLRGRLRVSAFAVFCLVFAAGLFWWSLAGPGGILRDSVAGGDNSSGGPAFWIPALVLVAARMALTAGIPPNFVQFEWDDFWFAKAGLSMTDGKWMGAYDEYALTKGCFGPMVLALSAAAGIPFLSAETALYALGCLFFVSILFKSFRNRPFLLAALFFLLFNPVSFSSYTWQRIYRNGMSLWQVPLVFGSFFAAYRACRGPLRRWFPWMALAGVSAWAFANTREDAVWIAPSSIAFMAASAVRTWKSGTNLKTKFLRALACLVPVAVVLAGNVALRAVNWRVYGVPLRNDRDSGNYAKAMRDLYLIAPDPEEEARLSGPEHAGHFHNISYSTIRQAYEASPALASASGEIDAAIDAWGSRRGYHGRDLFFDHVLFAIRLGVAKAGRYSSLAESERFFGDVHAELSTAFSSGRLKRRGVSIGAMAAPFRRKFVLPFLREWVRAVRVAVLLRDASGPEIPDVAGCRPEAVPVFERASRIKAPAPEDGSSFAAALERARTAAGVYSAVAPCALLVAFAFYVAVTVPFLVAGRRRFSSFADGWFLASSLLAGLFLHTAMIGYVSATTFPATFYRYLAASGQTALMFSVVAAGLFFETVRKPKTKTIMQTDPK